MCYLWTPLRLLFLLLIASSVLAGEPSPSQIDADGNTRNPGAPTAVMDPVVVTATRPDELPPHERTSSSVNLVEKEALPEHTSTVGEALDGVTGIDARSYGGSGARTAISIRGATPDQTAVYVDGMPMSSGGGGMTGLGSIPIGAVEKIEVYRGSAPGMFGAAAIGGVVHITTLKPGPEPEAELSTTYGSFNTQKQNIQGRFGVGENHAFSLAAGRYASDNDFEYYDDRQTPSNPDDDQWVTRRNADFEQRHLLGQWRWDSEKAASLSARLIYQETDRGVPGLGRDQALSARLDSDSIQGQLYYDYKSITGVRLWGAAETRRFDDPDDEAGRQGRQKTESDIDQWGASLTYAPVIGPTLTHCLLEYRQESYASSDAFDEAAGTPPSKREYIGAGLESEIWLLDEKMWVVPRVHYTYIDDELQKTSIRFAGDTIEEVAQVSRSLWTGQLGWRYQPKSALTLRANGGVYTRAPKFNELFGDNGDMVGNSDLQEERSINVDVGLHSKLASYDLEMDIAYFYRVTDDLIQRRDYGDYMIYENIAESEVSGIECWLEKGMLKNRLKMRLDMTWQRAINTSDDTAFRRDRYYGKDLPYHPRWLVSGKLDYSPWSFVTLNWRTRYESESFRGPSNLTSEKLEARTIHDASLKFFFLQHWELLLEIANVFDEQAVDFWGYPRPGVAYYATLRLTLP